MGDDANKRESRKVVHLKNLSERLEVPVDRFVLFDDAEANVNKVREVLGPSDAETGCSAICVGPADGLTAKTLLRGLEHRLAELRLRARFAKERRHEESRGAAYKEPLRKRKQSHAEELAQGQAALDDHFRVASKLEKLAVEPGWWLAAPLNPACSEPHGAVKLDWDLMDHAEQLFATCAWPSLADAEDSRLVRENANVVKGELEAGRIDLCALATYATERNLHYELLLHVSAEVEGDGMKISGVKRSRRAHVGAAAANRFVRADGSFRTQETERAVGYRPRHVQLLPMRSSHCDALRVLKRLLWRLEHLVRLNEPDVGKLFGAEEFVPPLERLSAALTHPGASAEAVRVSSSSLPPAPLDRYVHDERGCCQWEELEWLGDAMLRFYAVVWVLVHEQGTSVRGLSPAKEAIESNQQLHRRAKQLGLSGLSGLSLCAPFVNSSTLPQLRKQACSIKDQADPMEALLGTAALAAIHAAPRGTHALNTAIHAAFGFFHSAVLPPQQSPSMFLKSKMHNMAVWVQEELGTVVAIDYVAELTTFAAMLHSNKHIETQRDWDALLALATGQVGFESVVQLLKDVRAREHMHEKFWRYVKLQPLDTAAKLIDELVKQFELCHKDVENEEGAKVLSEALVAPSGPILFEPVRGMLHACSLCRSGTVFERAEFLGDAFLQIAVSLELARRYPGRKNGEVSEMRSALVSNLHLGRLLIRRFGVPLTHRFVETRGSGVANKSDQLRAIQTFIAATSSSSETAIDIVQAIHAASQAEEAGDKVRVRAQVLASNGLVEEDEPSGESQYHSKRGEDYRKPLGDQYEAIVGLVLCAYKGDCEATWRCFVDDFFPSPSPSSTGTEEAVDEDQRDELNAALHGLRKARFVNAIRRLQPEVPPLAAARPMAAGSPPVQPMERAATTSDEPPVQPMERAATTSDEPVLEPDGDPSRAHAQSAPRVGASPPAAVLGGEVCDEPMTQAVAPFASAVVVAAASLPSTAAAQQYPNPIGIVNERLQKVQISRDAFLRAAFSECAPFRVELFHIESSQLLGSAAGHMKKRDAEKAAFTDMLNCWDQRDVPRLLEQARQGGIQPALQAGVGSAPPPTSQPLAQPPQHAGSKRALEADICSLRAFASGLASGLARTLSPAVEMDETALEQLIDKVESNETYKHKIKRLATKAGLPLDVLEALAQKALELSRRVRPRPPEKEHSVGRLFHDVLLEDVKFEPAEYAPAKLPKLGDVVRIFGLQNAPQHNGHTGTVIATKEEQTSKGRLAIATDAVPNGIGVNESQLKLLRLGAESLSRLTPTARQLTYYLQEAELDDFVWPVLEAHGLELPLFFFQTYAKLRGVLDELQMPDSPQERLERLQAAVREAPTLSLCGEYSDRVRRRCDLEDAHPDNMSLRDWMHVEPSPADGGATFDAMVVPAEPPDAEPRVIRLPLRADYLYAITECLVSLAGGIGAPLGMYARYAGQKTEQPVLYFLIVSLPGEGHASAWVFSTRRNERASRIAGFDIYGDAIVADIELKPPHRTRPVSGGVPACERFLAMELADPL